MVERVTERGTKRRTLLGRPSILNKQADYIQTSFIPHVLGYRDKFFNHVLVKKCSVTYIASNTCLGTFSSTILEC